MDSIASAVFIRLDGDVEGKGMELSEITRPGVNGRAWKQEGVRGKPFELTGTVDVVSFAAADATISYYLGLQGSVVSFVQNSLSYSNFLVLSVSNCHKTPLGTAVGGINGGSVLLTSRWSLCYAGV